MFEHPFIVELDMKILMKYTQDVIYRQKPHDFNMKYLHDKCPVTTTSI